MMITEKQAAEMLGVTERTLRNYRAQGVAPVYVKLARGAIRYAREDVEAYLEAHRIYPAEQKEEAA